MRTISEREMIHERLGDHFQSALSQYDTLRRMETLVDEFLGRERVEGRSVLDVGCGLGYFTERVRNLGANVTACDLGPDLVRQTAARTGCTAVVADALNLGATFDPASFDIVLSSECVEHTPDPYQAVSEMCRMLKPGGYLSLSTPNIVWQPVVRAASALKLRPFDGLENFSTWRGLRRTLADEGVEVVAEKGLHIFPFQLGMHGLSRWCDANLQVLRGLMINLCILGRKRG